MPKGESSHSERIELRMPLEIKSVIERAAQLRHMTVSAYILESAVQKAQTNLGEAENFVLGDHDRDLFFSLLSTPPVPNQALRSLFKKDNV